MNYCIGTFLKNQKSKISQRLSGLEREHSAKEKNEIFKQEVSTLEPFHLGIPTSSKGV